MFGPKSRTLLELERYLEMRSDPPQRPSRFSGAVLAIGLAGLVDVCLAFSGSGIGNILVVSLIGGGAGTWMGFQAKKSLPPSADEILLTDAAVFAREMREQSKRRRLHLVLQESVGAILNECAGFWWRIVAASDPKLWHEVESNPQWQQARRAWISAAELGMAEALLLAQGSLNVRAPRNRAEEVVEDLLDTYVFTKNKGAQPLPAEFAPIRELAEKLRTLAVEVESARRNRTFVDSEVRPVDANKRLDEVLGELKSIREAEAELHQDMRG